MDENEEYFGLLIGAFKFLHFNSRHVNPMFAVSQIFKQMCFHL